MALPGLPCLPLKSCLLCLGSLQNLTALTPLRMRFLSLLDPACGLLTCSCPVPTAGLLTHGTRGVQEVAHQYCLQWENKLPTMRDHSSVCSVVQSRVPWGPNSQGAIIFTLHIIKLVFMCEIGIQGYES